MKKLMLVLLTSAVLTACSTTPTLPQTVQNANDIAPYPQASEGYVRYAINLPPLANENNARVELLIGKEINVDCNVKRLTGTIKQEELKGWGYSYYVVENVNSGISTMMACLKSTNKTEFVTVDHNLGWLDYNSRLPIMIYAPNDIQVKYRIWQPDSKVLPARVE